MTAIGKAFTKPNAPMSPRRLFNGEGWKPLDLGAVRQLCRGVKLNDPWRSIKVASSRYYSDDPLPIQEGVEGRPDLAGRERGSVIIVGYFGEISGRHYWVSRCRCGCFELLNERTLVKKPVSPHHICPYCGVLERQRYMEWCQDECEKRGLSFADVRQAYIEKGRTVSKHNGQGLIHFIRKYKQP